MSLSEEDLVLDPFCGSGTSLVSAHTLKRNWIGCEISEEAFSLTLERLEREANAIPVADFLALNQDELELQYKVQQNMGVV